MLFIPQSMEAAGKAAAADGAPPAKRGLLPGEGPASFSADRSIEGSSLGSTPLL